MQAALQEPTIAFAGERNLNVQHEWKEAHDEKREVSMADVVEAIKDLRQKFDEVTQAVQDKDTTAYISPKELFESVTDEHNKDARKNGKSRFDL